jgi:hypothetical protein
MQTLTREPHGNGIAHSYGGIVCGRDAAGDPPRREVLMALEKEMETYQKKLPDLQAQEGKFALIQGEQMDIFETYDAAINAGYQKYKLEPFLVKQIQAVEQVQFVTRLLGLPCRT